MDENFQDKHYDASFGPFTLTALQATKQSVGLDKDADFFWESVSCQYTGNSGNPGTPFSIRFTDSSGYELSDGLMGNFAFAAGTGIGVPYVLSVPLFFQAGSAILLDLLNAVNAENGPFQLLFHGRKRFYGRQG